MSDASLRARSTSSLLTGLPVASRTARAVRGALPTLVAALLLIPNPARAQNAALEERERVTAVDVYVELDADTTGPEGKARSVPKGLGVGDFEVRLAGERLPLVDYVDPRSLSEAEAVRLAEPWTVVLYFDLELAERDTVRWAASELVELIPELIELGDVELVVADGDGSRSLAPTRDAEVLENVLSGMVIDPGGVHGVLELRGEVLEAIREAPEDVLASDVGTASVEEEVSLVLERLDRLLIHLADRSSVGPAGTSVGSKRALFWVSDGFDLEPASFYRAQGLDLPAGVPDLTKPVESLSKTLASYGWVTIGLSPPPEGPGLVPGFRIGKWLYRARMPMMKGIGGTLVREHYRDPEKARAYSEIGENHLTRGDPEQAQESFELALYHFAGDPRTQEDQALAKAGLGRALEAQGEVAEARQAFRHAVELDPTLAHRYPQSRPRLMDALAFQTTAAAETSGRVVEDREVLLEALRSLSRRARLTYQVSGWPTGRSEMLEVALTNSPLDLYHPRWVRSGELPTVAAARSRQLVRGALEEGDLSVRAALEPAPGGGEVLEVNLDMSSRVSDQTTDRPIKLRLTVAVGSTGSVSKVTQEQFEIPSDRVVVEGETQGAWSHLQRIGLVADNEWVAVVVEDVETGLWGADIAY